MTRVAFWIIGALLGVTLLAFAFTLGYATNGGGGTTTIVQGADQEPSPPAQNGEVDFSTLNQILDILERDYVGRDTLNEQALYEAAINGLLDSLADTGTFYVDPASYQTSIGPAGSFEGIGATVSQQGDEIVVVSPIPNSPAEAAGIKSGDVILEVNGESTQGWTVEKAVIEIRGPKGTEVTLKVRHLDGTEEVITIVRDEIKIDSVITTPPGGVLRDAQGNEVTDIAYIRIREFTERTPQELEPLLREAEESGKRGVIIDLRGNPGGLLQQTVETADLFLDSGTILIEVDRDGTERIFSARPGGAALTIPVVVLQDQFSASGAEVLAAALKDNGRATIIGKTSFGKGTVNIARELKDGGALFVTIARWLTPDGVQIDGVGIRPDIEVTPGPFDPTYDPQNDVQIYRAIDHLRSLRANEAP